MAVLVEVAPAGQIQYGCVGIDKIKISTCRGRKNAPVKGIECGGEYHCSPNVLVVNTIRYILNKPDVSLVLKSPLKRIP